MAGVKFDLSPESRAERHFVEVSTGTETAKVPCIDSMTAAASIALNSAMKAKKDAGNDVLLLEYLRLYLGDVVDTLSPAEFAELGRAVSQAAEVGLGE